MTEWPGDQVADRNPRLEVELAKKKEELARSNAELQHFAYVASHDLQEPLRMVASYVGLLARRYRGRLDRDADEFIAFALDGVRRMQGLIDDLLTYSRVGTRGRQPEPVDSARVLGDVLADLRPAVEECGAEVSCGGMPVVMADRSQLGQLLHNLIGNALKFRGRETPKVSIGAERSDGTWIFAVRDNGIGIEPRHAERIFQAFQRLHTRAEYPGNGIGLAVCKRIVERHGGRIWVESGPGKGATFFFTVPATPAESEPESAGVAPPAQRQCQ